ncbi:hypothetical protein K2173_012630 [Erythroxylum novogranatense]|uniref:CBS domain-containing protein n=1 Tax=Erythroxylum novogranatense TaxID=1862640 RepID=A0AAV8TJQ1_9ROSI|nr:hypothetical protein K2173_012630 [Erythroxylum novogranatense]
MASFTLTSALPISRLVCYPRHMSCRPLVSASPANMLRQVWRCRCLAAPSRHFPRTFSMAGNESVPPGHGKYTVGDFMIKKENLFVVKTTTTVDQALLALVENRITGFPVVDDDWKLVGVVSDYDLLALDSISGGNQIETNLFPNVDSSWKKFNELQKVLVKTRGKVVGDLMTPNPLVVHEATDIDAVARLLLETKYHRLPVVDSHGKLVGVISREDVVKAALEIKRASETST